MKAINMELIHNHVLCKRILIILSRFLKKTYDNNFSFKTKFETPFYFCQMVKKTFGPSTYLMKERFTTLTNHNQQHFIT